MITEKGRPAKNGPEHKLPGPDFTAPLIGPSNVGQGECGICGMATSNGEQVHAGCADAVAFSTVPSNGIALEKATLEISAGFDTTPGEQLTDAETSRALEIARDLVRAGVPVFTAPPCPGDTCTRTGHPNPKQPFDLPGGWQKTLPDASRVDEWRPGEALCALGGHTLDVLDTDPRNFYDKQGHFLGDGAADLRDAGEWPVSYGQASTPSGGTHDLIAPLGVGKGVPAQGIDLQGGKPDGTGIGFVFISPTVRKSKADGIARPYRWTVEPDLPRLAVEGPTDTSGQGVVRRLTDKRAKPAAPEVPRQANSPVYGAHSGLPARDVDARVQELCDKLASAPEGDGNNTAARIGHMVGQYVGAGQLTAWEAESCLTGALAGWSFAQPGDEATMRDTIRKQIAEGTKSPRAWEPGRNGTAVDMAGLLPPRTNATEISPDEIAGAEKESTSLEAMLARFVDRSKVSEIKPPKPLVKDTIFKGTLARMAGKPGDGKSFMALDLACCVATGMDWHGRPVARGKVVYLAAEGLSGLALRLQAWERHHGQEVEGLFIYPEAIQVASADWPLFVECCRRLGADLIVIDTQARVTAGVEENSATAMGEVVDRLERLRRHTGATVLLIHHLTHNGDHARGSTAVLGALDTELTVSMDKGSRVVTMKVTKQKDAAESEPVQLALTGVPLGLDDEGEPVGSAVLVTTSGQECSAEDELMGALTHGRVKVLEVLAMYGPTLGATKAELTKWATEAGVSKTTAYRAVDDLDRLGHLEQRGQRFFLSDDQKRARRVFEAPHVA